MRPNWWFTADLHLNHTAIISHCKRPWKTSYLMELALIDIWNQYVKPKDVIVILGDFWFGGGKQEDILEFAHKNLNGNKIFVKGNHDNWYKKDKRYMYTKSIDGIKTYGCHYPLASWPSGICLHGHSHGNMEKIVNRFDVGIDTNPEYRPYNFDEIKQWINYDYLSRRTREGRE